ncbi:GNAT family N-acetyltransferase [Microvirga pakistanensis]|uniref:GNAT family N-acetyltransferase n=1 Tax=Microvirga pakistanensis TaxID=1682650 RepID=UPI00106D0CBD|nr:GNAT family N-acetyltransferase [Microvirga pakistanensis]
MSTIKIRQALASDAALIARLIRSAFAQQPVVLQPTPSALSVTPSKIKHHFQENGGGAVASLISEEVGCCLWSLKGNDMHLTRLAVSPKWRRRGIASSLLHYAGEAARNAKVTRMTLSTRLALTGNRRLFASIGFREVAFHTHPGFDTPTAVELERLI